MKYNKKNIKINITNKKKIYYLKSWNLYKICYCYCRNNLIFRNSLNSLINNNN